MNKYKVFILIFLFLSCDKEIIEPTAIKIPSDAVEFLEFETRITYLDSVSLYAANKNNYSSFKSQLNDEEVDLFSSITLREAGYYELKIAAINTIDTLDLFFQFVITDSERGQAEWGIKKFSPKAIEDKPFSISKLEFMFPANYPKDLCLPVIMKAKESMDKWGDYYAHLSVDNKPTTIKRGIGSILLLPDRSANNINVNLYGEEKDLDIIDSEPDFIQLEGIIDNDIVLEEGGYYHLTSDMTIAHNTILQIDKGCIVKVDEGVNIYNNGQVIILGSDTQPVVFACSEPSSNWGGFISIGEGTSIEVQHVIFTQSGFHDSSPYQYGHAKRQALFYMENSELSIVDAHFIDNIGQVFYLHDQSKLTIENTLIQRAITAGEVSGSEVEISQCTFTDFPEYSARYLDQDNDCIYLSKTDAIIQNSNFMWSKDDGIDSGASGGGNVKISNCYFEGILHEAIALSSAGTVLKNHDISHSVFKNNGQGVELGYSSPNHQVKVTACHFEDNMIGVRYGDNYDRVVSGKMELINCSFSANSDKDIWNFVRSEWGSIDENLIF